MYGYDRRIVRAPAAIWEKAAVLARREGCTVNDLLAAAAERALSEPCYGQRIGQLAANLFRPLSQWPSDPIEYLLLAWCLNSRAVPNEQSTSTFESYPDWWKS
jgi:hypothetical protein